uniref:Similar to HERV-H protease and HERV-E integrase n=2 Tax=root TaxID=1 RepID=Q68997_9RETR|nr:Method: conceptual translation supplied by author; putative hybrid protein similar to HERV-H protease and HERV-E integrase [Human endogenous retrovirus]
MPDRLPQKPTGPSQMLYVTLTVEDDRVWIKDWKVASLCPRWKGPQTIVLSTPTAVKVEGIPAWIQHSHIKPAGPETWEARPSPDNPCRVTLKKTTSPAPVTPRS